MHSRIPRLKPLSRFALSLFLLFSAAGLFPLRAQQVEMTVVATPELMPDDPDAASYYRQTDVNDKVCALIKVKPSNPMDAVLVLNTGGGMAPVQEKEALSHPPQTRYRNAPAGVYDLRDRSLDGVSERL